MQMKSSIAIALTSLGSFLVEGQSQSSQADLYLPTYMDCPNGLSVRNASEVNLEIALPVWLINLPLIRVFRTKRELGDGSELETSKHLWGHISRRRMYRAWMSAVTLTSLTQTMFLLLD
jgi:hypothetical protein